MKIGTLGYSNNSGLGSVIAALRKHLNVQCQFVIPHPSKGCYVEGLDCQFSLGSVKPTIKEFEDFLYEAKPDLMVVVETPFNWDFLKLMKEKKIKVVFIPLIDQYPWAALKGFAEFVDLWLCPSMAASRGADDIGIKHTYLPWPVDARRFEFFPRGGNENLTFVHAAGFWGIRYRKGTDVLRDAWVRGHRSGDKLRVFSQLAVPEGYFPPDVELIVGDLPDPKSLYEVGDVYVAPSRKEGIGLSIYEAMASGLPVIASDIEPANEILYRDWLIKLDRPALQSTDEAQPSVQDLHQIFMTIDSKVVVERSFHARVIAEEFSWCTWKDSYLEVLESVCD